MKYDAIVVGAGPAGSTAAFTLARTGMRVLLCDSAEFPREKLCGGLLSERAEKSYRAIFNGPWQDAVLLRTSGAAFYDGFNLVRKVDTHPAPLYLTSRSLFDSHLVSLACKAGAEFQQRSGVREVDAVDCSVTLAGGTRYSADFLLGCDGANSRVARAVGTKGNRPDQTAAGLEINLPADRLRAAPDVPAIYFGVVPWGYGWVFPKGEYLTIGVGGLVSKNARLKETFAGFLAGVCGDQPDIRWKGHPIPFGNFSRNPGRKNVLLAGDAAGLVEPITGEGIAFAIQSGNFAGRAVIESAAAGAPDSALDRYTASLADIRRLFRHASWLRLLIFPQRLQSLFLSVLNRNETVALKYLDLLADRIDYADYANFILRRLAAKTARAAKKPFGGRRG